jgi:type II secretory pathway pseudopilin PulG
MRMSRRSGFSVVELTIALIMVGILAGIAIPRMDLSRMRSDGSLRQLSMLFMQAQRTALSKQYNVLLSFDLANNRIRLVEDRNNSDTFDTGDREVWTVLEPGTTFTESPLPLDGISGKVSFVRPRVIDGFPSVIFRRNGAASSDGAMFITANPLDIGAVRALAITQSTGRADGFKYNGARWVRAGA